VFESKKIEKFDVDLTSDKREFYLNNFELKVLSKIDSVLTHWY
jgi:hypothetical protein